MAYVDTIQFITMASAGNATDFGDRTTTAAYMQDSGVSSTTRGIISGGMNVDADNVNILEYVTMSSAGNATDFGDLTVARRSMAGLSSATRGITAGGQIPGGRSNVIDYVTIASTGNASDFGNLIADAANVAACANTITGLISGGNFDGNPSRADVIQSITIASTGNTTDFGDLTVAKRHHGGASPAAASVQG